MEYLENLVTHFSSENLSLFLRSKIPQFVPQEEDYSYLFEDKSEILENYKNIYKLGEAELDNSEELIVITAKVVKNLTTRSSKKRQYEIAKKILKEENRDAAFFIFYDDNGNFRFSFIRANYLGTKREFTEFKRYTYFVSPNLTNKTFKKQIEKADFTDLDSIQEAFSVEPLNKEFYQSISHAFYSLVGGKVAEKEYQQTLRLPEGDRKDYQNFAVRLIGRIIFVWFLKKKTSEAGEPLIPDEWLKPETIEKTENYYHDYLEKLFFEILNKPIKERPFYLPKGHEKIPFLNGGLFEPQNNDHYDSNQLGFSSDYNTLHIPNEWFKELFETLERFNFTIDENSPDDLEISIDPEMLGTIFENLLAEIDPETQKSARKATGSYYTPREIVDFMVEQSLLEYLKNKTGLEHETLIGLLRDTDVEIKLSKKQKNAIIDCLESVKILDPACGSGSFLMGALHKITTILQKVDKDARIWKEKHLSKIKDPILKETLKKKLDKSDVDYIRKLGIIQNSLYGVDIQEIAIEIAKLRFFLSLIVDETIDDEEDNRGIFPLPNLELKLIPADTLKNLPKVRMPDLFGHKKEIDKLKELRAAYLQSYGEEKERIKREFIKTQNIILSPKTITKTADFEEAIGGWDPFKNESVEWFDPKWMFGVDGFDIVIGNPPYIQLQKAHDDKNKYADLYKNESYETFERTGDIYALFYEKGINLLKNGGFLCFITSNKWMRAKYGKKLREFLSKYNPVLLIDLGPNVFSSATVDTNILLVQKSEQEEIKLKALTLKDKNKLNSLTDEDFTVLNSLGSDSWIILSPIEQRIKEKIEKIGTPLKDWDVKIYRGVLTGFNEAFIIDGKTKDELIAKDPKSAEIIKPILRGRDIKRYKAEFADKWLIFIPWHFPLHENKNIVGASKEAEKAFQEQYPALYEHLFQYKDKLSKRNRAETGIRYEWYALQRCAATYYEEFEKEKIVWQEIVREPSFALDTQGFYPEATAFFMTGENLKYLLPF